MAIRPELSVSEIPNCSLRALTADRVNSYLKSNIIIIKSVLELKTLRDDNHVIINFMAALMYCNRQVLQFSSINLCRLIYEVA